MLSNIICLATLISFTVCQINNRDLSPFFPEFSTLAQRRHNQGHTRPRMDNFNSGSIGIIPFQFPIPFSNRLTGRMGRHGRYPRFIPQIYQQYRSQLEDDSSRELSYDNQIDDDLYTNINDDGFMPASLNNRAGFVDKDTANSLNESIKNEDIDNIDESTSFATSMGSMRNLDKRDLLTVDGQKVVKNDERRTDKV